MPLRNYINITSTSVGILLIGMLVVSAKLYITAKQNKSLKDKLSLENTIHQNQISEILKRYDSLHKITGKEIKNELQIDTILSQKEAITKEAVFVAVPEHA